MAFCWLKIPSFLWFTPWLSILNSTSGTPTPPTIGFPAVIPTTGLQQFSGRRMWQPQAEYYFGCMFFLDYFKNLRIWNHPSCGWTIVIHGHVWSFWHHLCTFGWANTIQPIQPSGAVVHIQHDDSLVGICNSEEWISIWHALNHGLKRYRRCIIGLM